MDSGYKYFMGKSRNITYLLACLTIFIQCGSIPPVLYAGQKNQEIKIKVNKNQNIRDIARKYLNDCILQDKIMNS